MGQKVHPGGLRVGVIHDWKSNWYTGKKEFADYLLEDIKIREHINGKLVARGPVRHPDPQGQAADHGRHLHRAPGHRDRQVRRRGGRAPQGAARDHAARTSTSTSTRSSGPSSTRKLVAQSIAEQLQNRVSFRRAMKRSLASAMRSGAQGIKIQCGGRLGGGEMSRRETLLRGPRPAAHDPRRHRLRLRRGEDDLRPHRRQGLDQQGRDHARGLRGRHRRRDARLGDQDQARRRRGGAAEGLGASRESGRGRGQDREGLGLVRQRRGAARRRPGRRPGRVDVRPARRPRARPGAAPRPRTAGARGRAAPPGLDAPSASRRLRADAGRAARLRRDARGDAGRRATS